ncbi:MAG: hypothetical protein JSV89_07515 [Spirochaetaceae bacterium]|nr:MAG: hypothetical protein JSV89_07515 [Spirochaetaceae bacterium]
MTCEQWSEEFKRWLDQDWTKRIDLECPSSVRQHAQSCPRCGPRLQAALLLVQGTPLYRQAPPGLAERIAARLGSRESLRPRLKPLWIGIPAAAVLVIALSIGLMLSRPGGEAKETIVVRFELTAPEAREVAVVGNWNRWDPQAQKLEDRDGDGVWEIEIPLKRGQEHQYQFLIDGQTWIPDPEAPLQVEDGFGGVNSVLQI